MRVEKGATNDDENSERWVNVLLEEKEGLNKIIILVTWVAVLYSWIPKKFFFGKRLN